MRPDPGPQPRAGASLSHALLSLLTPICSPELLEGRDALTVPEDLRRHKLLYVYTAEEDWRIWLEAAGVKGIELSDQLAFDSYILAQEAAIEARHRALCPIALGRLVQPFDLKVPHRHSWVFACDAANRLMPKIRRFEAWLADQVAEDGASRLSLKERHGRSDDNRSTAWTRRPPSRRPLRPVPPRRAGQSPKRRSKLPFPPVDLLSVDQIESIHETSLEVLREVGMEVMLPEARDRLKAAGAEVRDSRVTFPRELVESARTAPSR